MKHPALFPISSPEPEHDPRRPLAGRLARFRRQQRTERMRRPSGPMATTPLLPPERGSLRRPGLPKSPRLSPAIALLLRQTADAISHNPPLREALYRLARHGS